MWLGLIFATGTKPKLLMIEIYEIGQNGTKKIITVNNWDTAQVCNVMKFSVNYCKILLKLENNRLAWKKISRINTLVYSDQTSINDEVKNNVL